MKLTFDISAIEFVIVRDILADIIPLGCRVWVFGSRVKNQARFNSDLDLAFECKDKLPQIILHKLKEAFSDSLLPYRVDVLDINDVSESFQTIIRQQAIAFPLSKSDKVPKLRFPEFSGEWKKNLLGKLFPKIRNGFVGTATPYYQEVGIKYLQGKNIKNGSIDPKGMINVSVEFHEWQKKSQLKSGDILMVQSGHVGECAVVTDEYYGANCHALVVMSPIENVSSTFVRNLFYASTCLRLIKKIKTGNTIAHILTSDLKQLAINVPSTLPEQKKIAAFLSAIDQKIEQLTKKKALLEQYKRGVMQKLFSQELRFKDAQGKAFPDWVEKRLGEVATFKKGKGISKADIVEDGKNPCIRYGELYTEYNEVIKSIVSRTNTEVGSSILSEKNDILMPTSDVTPNGLATASALDETNIILGGDILIIRTKRILNSFFCYFVASHKNKIMRLVSGVTVYHIYGSDMATVHVNIPSFPEQQKITLFLSAIDLKIDLINTKLERTQAFKKGLLQQMFV